MEAEPSLIRLTDYIEIYHTIVLAHFIILLFYLQYLHSESIGGIMKMEVR